MFWVELLLAATVPLVAIVVLINRLATKRGPGVRVTQFTAVGMTIPVVALLALRNMLEGEAVAAILAGLVGYLFANIAKFDERA